MKPAGSVLVIRAISLVVSLLASYAPGARQLEALGRGIVAVRQADANVFISWRVLGADTDDLGFNLYRSTDGGPDVRLNEEKLTGATWFIDEQADPSKHHAYTVRVVLQGIEHEPSAPSLVKSGAQGPYLSVPLKTPEGYTANDGSVGDLDGDGEYEIVIHMAGRGRDNAQAGLTDPPILQAYKLDGTLLWTIRLGLNIREGAHYTQFIVYDLDGDGRAEVACKTADGTSDARGRIIGDPNADWRFLEPRNDPRFGKILDGPEYFTVFDGKTGAALATVPFIPPRGDLGGWGGVGGNAGNDHVGNRADRFLAGVAYLDGRLPSVVMCRGYYGRSVLAAWDWRENKLTSRWVFDTANGYPDYAGQGNHSLSVADVDADGRDEIIYGAMCVDHNGKGLYSTGLRHGDALHVGDLDPSRPGLEVWGIHENETRAEGPGVAFRSANTGEIYWSDAPGRDVGRGLAADIDPRYWGAEMWGGSIGLRNGAGNRIGNAPPTTNFAVWWDGDLLRELLDRNVISKWNWESETLATLLTAEGCAANNGSKATPVLSGDILGDWREEVIWRTRDSSELRIYTSTIPTPHRIPTLMHDHQYRLAIAWQNVGYNQPPHPSFYLGEPAQ